MIGILPIPNQTAIHNQSNSDMNLLEQGGN